MARVLVVDDDEGVREFVVDALELDGHRAYDACDGPEALALLNDGTPFDVIVTDLRMPGMSGLELIERAMRLDPNAHVVMLTAHGTVENAVDAMRAGAFDYLQKPVESPEALRRVVRRAAASRAAKVVAPVDERAISTVPPLSYGAPAMVGVVDAVTKVARTEATVLLLGESGTGKEIAARTIHTLSARHSGPFVAINCAAIADSLIDSELFGHERGAFTGAIAKHAGRFERAAGGTLFLDEIAELKPELQAKLLRVLEERKIERVGGTQAIPINVRIVAATHQHIRDRIADGRFREDLYHRLAVFPIAIPPLRERKEDIPQLAEALLLQLTAAHARKPVRLAPEALKRLVSARFSGNVRELRNTLERALILAEGATIEASDLLIEGEANAPTKGPALVTDEAASLADLERRAIEQALAANGGNRRLAAEALGIGLRTLYDKLKRYETT
jgi:two-component system response regulator AtoC